MTRTHVQQFDLLVCALAATNYQGISCLKHPDDPVALELVVPDLLLTDLPLILLLIQKILIFSLQKRPQLGEGGAGGVYSALYKGNPIAVKQFHSAKKTKYGLVVIRYLLVLHLEL